MLSSEEFDSIWIDRLRDEQTRDEASRVILEAYGAQLKRLAQRELSRRFAGRVAHSDIVQDVCLEFLKGNWEIEHRSELTALLMKLTLNVVRKTARDHTAQKRDVRREEGEFDSKQMEGVAGAAVRFRSDHASDYGRDRRANNAPTIEPPSLRIEALGPDALPDSEQCDDRSPSAARESNPTRPVPTNGGGYLDDDDYRMLAAGANPEQAAAFIDLLEGLSDTHRAIVIGRMTGLRDAEIAERLGLSGRNVSRKIVLIKEKLTAQTQDSLEP